MPDPWERVCVALKDLGGAATHLVAAEAELRGDVLRLSLPAGRELAQGERAARMESVRSAVERYYPEGTRLQLVARPGTGTYLDRKNAMRQLVLDDPRMQPVIEAFGARVDNVTRLDEEEAEE